jgi:hypothetical protein
MENPIHSPWKRTSLSHSQRTGFPQLRIKASYAHSHNAYCGEYLSFPFLKFKMKSGEQCGKIVSITGVKK